MTFHVGQKVVCVRGPERAPIGVTQPIVGRLYIVRQKYVEPVDGRIGIRLVGITNPIGPSNSEWGFYADRFRPIISRKTDISIFTAMLNPSQVTVDALNTADFARESAQ